MADGRMIIDAWHGVPRGGDPVTEPSAWLRHSAGLLGWGTFTDDDEGDDYYRQSTTACCPRQTIPDSCSCLEGCDCVCTDCVCGAWGEEYEDD